MQSYIIFCSETVIKSLVPTDDPTKPVIVPEMQSMIRRVFASCEEEARTIGLYEMAYDWGDNFLCRQVHAVAESQIHDAPAARAPEKGRVAHPETNYRSA